MIFKVTNLFKCIGEKFIDFLAPPRCPSCEDIVWSSKPKFWCPSCWENSIPWLNKPFCTKCGTPFRVFPDRISQDNGFCSECLSDPPEYDMIRSACLYEGIVTKLIVNLKYRKWLFYVPPLGEILEKAFLTWFSEEHPDFIIPVPMHIQRLKDRGFNQSLLLAKELAKKVKIPCKHNIVMKVRNTTPQTKLNRTERKRNLRQAFIVSESAKVYIKDASVLIVDDVITTGTTILECAKVLKKAGAARVIGISVARSP